MDREAQIQAIEEDLDALQGMPVDSHQSARDVLTQAMVAVRRINQLLAQAQAQAMMGAGAPMDDILARLREWVGGWLPSSRGSSGSWRRPRRSRSRWAPRCRSRCTSARPPASDGLAGYAALPLARCRAKWPAAVLSHT